MNYKKNQTPKPQGKKQTSPLSGLGRTELRVLFAFRDKPEMTYPELVATAYPDLTPKEADGSARAACYRLKRRGLLKNEKYNHWEITADGKELFVQKKALKPGWKPGGNDE